MTDAISLTHLHCHILHTLNTYSVILHKSQYSWAQMLHLHTHGKVSRMHGTCSNRSMLITTCTTLRPICKHSTKSSCRQIYSKRHHGLSGRETGETSACISCSPQDVGLKFTFLQKKMYLFQSIHMQVKYLIIAYML